MSVDPILPLSLSIAEGERTYALFLGSGISNKAGVPTGGDIFWETIKLLYEMDNSALEVEAEEIKTWYQESEYNNWGYSEILESLYPSREDRRNFLEKFFLGKNPTEAHNVIAEMVEKKLVKCIITTNFDKLMEQALDERGVAYDVVASSKDLMELKPREHSNCRILKLHGDYQKSDLKNTRDELENLDEKLEKEFKEILENYGIIVIGYSGSDNGVMKCFEERNNPRYTLYWVTRDHINGNLNELIQQQSGKNIVRSSADDFLKELLQKIDIYQTHPTGESPEFLIQKIIEYLRFDDYIGFSETLKRQKREIEKKYYEISQKTDKIFRSHKDFEPLSQGIIIVHKIGEKPKVNKSLDIPINGFVEFERFVNVLTAIGLALIEYGSLKYFQNVLKVLYELFDLPPLRGVDLRVSNISKAAVHNVYYQWGAYAIKKENFDVLNELLNYKIIINNLSYSELESKEIWLLLEGKNIITFDRDPNKIFELLLDSYKQKEFIKEFFNSYEEFLKFIYQFNLILCLYSIKKYDGTIYAHSSRLERYYSRMFIEPLLFKIKTDLNFNYSISEVFNDFEYVDGEKLSTFISNFPKRCEKINKNVENDIFFEGLRCDYFKS